MAIGTGAVFYDGSSARARAVTLRFADALEIRSGGDLLATWAYGEVRRREGPPGLMRLGTVAGPELARLEVADPEQQAEAAARCPALDAEEGGRGATVRIVGWSLAAAASVVLTAVFLVPLAADRLAGLVPPALERRLGAAVDNQVRATFGGATCTSPAGEAALARLTRQIAGSLAEAPEVEVAVLRSSLPNAFALPGGRIYLLDGLLRRAESPDEVAGVLAHEIGHVAHRDGLRRLLQTGGTSFLLGLLFGDVTGGAAIVVVGRTLIDGAYSRDAERAADGFASRALAALGRSPEPLGRLLRRIDDGDGIPPFLSSHPLSAERLAALGSRPVAKPGPPLLSDAEWQALRNICRTG
ncbi:MAG TPA: M48 family metallopeptidase [Microvirga sp.]|jgi:predicted Zn-dependent protease|nr:M48 family metallopeptidase [Microvirga sp.]